MVLSVLKRTMAALSVQVVAARLENPVKAAIPCALGVASHCAMRVPVCCAYPDDCQDVVLLEHAVASALAVPAVALIGVASAGLAPMPASCTVLVAFPALINATLPVTLPGICGANVTVKEGDLPRAVVAGRFNPVALNPAPVTFICETVTVALPLLVTVTG